MSELSRTDTASSETARLRDLYSLRLLDTQREERFDQYADLLADLFDVPIAYISLISQNRQWFKATHGTEMRELDRKEAFCAVTVANDQPLVSEDLARDPRFASNWLVRKEPGLRFYAGAPIHGPSGYPVGTVGLLDFVPREFSPQERRHLALLGGVVEQEILHDHQVDGLRRDLQKAAYYDAVTGLPNQRLLIERLQFVIDLAVQQKKKVFYALVDLQHFGTVNQAHGWEMGNEILRAVARRLVDRHTTPHVVARWHGDQFVVVSPMEHSTANLKRFAEGIMRCFDEPFTLRGEVTQLSARAGISLASDHGTDALALIHSGHTAMRAAAHDGWNNYKVYSSGMERLAVRRQNVAECLRAGLRNGKITLAYQPMFDLHSDRYTTVEALVRWFDAELGYVPPEELLEIAQRVGLQEELELAILSQACTDAAKWQRKGCDMSVSVNLSATQFYKQDLVDQVKRTLEQTGLSPQRLILEITEQATVQDMERAIASMQMLSDYGVRVAIDDFGIGYSSFAYLAELPVHAVKIDRRIVMGVSRGHNSANVVSGIIHLAHALELKVVAEGIESEDQVGFLRDTGCDQLQGFFFSRPRPPSELPGLTGGP